MHRVPENTINYFSEQVYKVWQLFVYVERYFTSMSYSACLNGLILSTRFMSAKHSNGTYIANKNNYGMVIIVGLMLANKYLDDIPYRTDFFSKAFGITIKTLKESEIIFLKAIGYNCDCSRDEWKCFPYIENFLRLYNPSFCFSESIDATATAQMARADQQTAAAGVSTLVGATQPLSVGAVEAAADAAAPFEATPPGESSGAGAGAEVPSTDLFGANEDTSVEEKKQYEPVNDPDPIAEGDAS